MFATVVHVSIQDQAKAQRGLEEEVIPMLKGASGFVCAYFVALDDSHGVSVAVFDSEEQARAAAPSADGPGMAGITVDTVQFGFVIGTA